MTPRPKSRQVPLDLDKAGMLRRLHAEGALWADLARAFGVSVGTVYAVVGGRVFAERQCPGCWRLLAPSEHHRGLCAQCRSQFCNHCGGSKSPGRKSARCAPCDRANFQRVVATHPQCRECGEELPETRRDRLCADCRDADRAIQQQFRDNRGKLCRQCQAALPEAKSWSRLLCRACAKEHDRRRRSLSRRQCGICGKTLGDQRDALCLECRRVDRRIREQGKKDQAA